MLGDHFPNLAYPIDFWRLDAGYNIEFATHYVATDNLGYSAQNLEDVASTKAVNSINKNERRNEILLGSPHALDDRIPRDTPRSFHSFNPNADGVSGKMD